ncbi:hypothetical protein WMF38_22915 [Sorangium sp. So ce118]
MNSVAAQLDNLDQALRAAAARAGSKRRTGEQRDPERPAAEDVFAFVKGWDKHYTRLHAKDQRFFGA